MWTSRWMWGVMTVSLLVGEASAQDGRGSKRFDASEAIVVDETKDYPMGEVYCHWQCSGRPHASHAECDTSCDAHDCSDPGQKDITLEHSRAQEHGDSFTKEFLRSRLSEMELASSLGWEAGDKGGLSANVSGRLTQGQEESLRQASERSVRVNVCVGLSMTIHPTAHWDQPCTSSRATWGYRVKVRGTLRKHAIVGYDWVVAKGRYSDRPVESVFGVSGDLVADVVLYLTRPTRELACQCGDCDTPQQPPGWPGGPPRKNKEDCDAGSDGQEKDRQSLDRGEREYSIVILPPKIDIVEEADRIRLIVREVRVALVGPDPTEEPGDGCDADPGPPAEGPGFGSDWIDTPAPPPGRPSPGAEDPHGVPRRIDDPPSDCDEAPPREGEDRPRAKELPPRPK